VSSDGEREEEEKLREEGSGTGVFACLGRLRCLLWYGVVGGPGACGPAAPAPAFYPFAPCPQAGSAHQRPGAAGERGLSSLSRFQQRASACRCMARLAREKVGAFCGDMRRATRGGWRGDQVLQAAAAEVACAVRKPGRRTESAGQGRRVW